MACESLMGYRCEVFSLDELLDLLYCSCICYVCRSGFTIWWFNENLKLRRSRGMYHVGRLIYKGCEGAAGVFC